MKVKVATSLKHPVPVEVEGDATVSKIIDAVMAVDADYFDGRQKEDASAVIKGHIYGVHDAIEADKLDSDHCIQITFISKTSSSSNQRQTNDEPNLLREYFELWKTLSIQSIKEGGSPLPGLPPPYHVFFFYGDDVSQLPFVRGPERDMPLKPQLERYIRSKIGAMREKKAEIISQTPVARPEPRQQGPSDAAPVNNEALQNAFQAYLQQMAAHEDEAEGRGQAPHWVNQGVATAAAEDDDAGMAVSEDELSELNVPTEIVETLTDMGFNKWISVRALVRSNNDLDGAMDWIQDHQDDDGVHDPITVQEFAILLSLV